LTARHGAPAKVSPFQGAAVYNPPFYSVGDLEIAAPCLRAGMGDFGWRIPDTGKIQKEENSSSKHERSLR